jgi:hypothetical protein
MNGVLHKKMLLDLPSKAIANAIDGIKPYLKRMIKNVIF